MLFYLILGSIADFSSRKEDFYAYFNFLGVPNCEFYRNFYHSFCKVRIDRVSLSLGIDFISSFLFTYSIIIRLSTHTDWVYYKQGGEAATERLVDVLKPLLHRKTYESTYFGRPIIPLRNIKESEKVVEFCNVEKVIYDEILNMGIEEYNGKSKIHEYGVRVHTDIFQRFSSLPTGKKIASFLSSPDFASSPTISLLLRP